MFRFRPGAITAVRLASWRDHVAGIPRLLSEPVPLATPSPRISPSLVPFPLSTPLLFSSPPCRCRVKEPRKRPDFAAEAGSDQRSPAPSHQINSVFSLTSGSKINVSSCVED
ncbi:hypothetical protein ZWY2020_005079 [Hordeum vulgare]|nr:hypothetical protein ZWY2020_005079 [Hordeum vulgare]